MDLVYYFTVGNTGMQYGQNISLPYSHAQPPQPTDHNNMFQNDHKNNINKTKMERDRDDGECLGPFPRILILSASFWQHYI